MPPREAFADHLDRPRGRRHTPVDAFTGAAGGATCGDLVRISLSVDRDDPQGRVLDTGFDASGCGAALAAGSAAVTLVRGSPLLAAARIGAEEIAGELGGLTVAKRHASELAADALHRALGAAARERARLEPSRKRTLVAMSGGVDSAVAALLLAREGEEVIAVTLELWSDAESDGERSCCSAQAVRAARSLAHTLGMPHFSIDLRAEFRAGVVEPWLAEHARGLTPYACLRCNGSVRLDAMLALAERLGAPVLATGHYARLHHDARSKQTFVQVSRDPAKDQSYALAALAPETLARVRFPLGELSKSEVRLIAARAGLAVAGQPDSQDLCFLAGTDRTRFLARHAKLEPVAGAIVDVRGRKLGEHGSIHRFTVGQRRGLGIGGREPRFVLATDPRANTVTVGSRESLLTNAFELEDVRLRNDARFVNAVKIRARGACRPCKLAAPSTSARAPEQARRVRMTVELAQPLERTAPGQIACLYRGDVVVGYGTVARVSPRIAYT